MKDYSQFPPLKYFLRVLKNCPKSALLYIELWKKRGDDMIIRTQKQDIRKEYLLSPTLFRNLLAPLMFLHLVNFVEEGNELQIDVSGQPLNE